MSHKKVDLVFTEKSFKEIETMSQNMNVSVDRVIAQAIALLKLVQGRRVILKDDKESVELHNYRNLPPQTEIKI